jgi:alpha-beta hydrolase superfamily lysophospholipase
LTIAELDKSFVNTAKRDALLEDGQWPVVIFSHGSGAFRGSYTNLTEYLASNGYIVIACDHPTCARFTIVNGTVVRRTGPAAGTAGFDDF